MAIAFGTASASAATGSTSLSVAYPASIAAGDLLLLFVCNKYPTNGPSTPSGWSTLTDGQGSGGAGASGIDTGSTYCTVFYRIADGSESGNVSVTITSGNSAVGVINRYTKAADKDWALAACQGADTAGGSTTYTFTGNVDPGLTAADFVVAAAAINSDTYTYSAQGITATGISAWGTVTERWDAGTTTGQDCKIVVSDHPVTTGTSSEAPVFTMTASGSATNSPAGAGVMVRLREVDPPAAGFDPLGMAGFFGG